MFENDINLLYSKENCPPASSVERQVMTMLNFVCVPATDSKRLCVGYKPASAASVCVCVCTETLIFPLLFKVVFSVSPEILLNLVYCVQVCVTDVDPWDATEGQISSWANLTYQEHGPKKSG